MRAFLGLGANLAQPEQQILSAIASLRISSLIMLVACSRLYASLPMGPQDQPDYINAVVEIETELSPFALLDFCQQLEHNHQREREAHWGARTLDVDILSIDDIVMNSERLVLPHPGIAMRDFVVLPWRDIAPNYLIPALGYVDQIQIKDDFSARPLSSLSYGVSSL
jgi:2-amino-4-hydroxy-6-hydroxymethyldihydropteridine diphosphokinase